MVVCCLLFSFCCFCFCLVCLSVCMYKRTNSSNNKQQNLREKQSYRRKSLTIEWDALRINTNNSWKPLTIEGSPLLISNLFTAIPYYRTNNLSISYNEIPYYRRKKPLVWKEHLPLLSKEILYYRMKSLAIKEIHYYRRKSLTIEGNALQITTTNSWKSLAIGRSPLLMRKLSKQIPYYRKKPVSIL